MLREIPRECINSCSHSGDCTQDVQRWIKKLNFNVPSELARKYLKEFGAWEDLEWCSQDILNERVLWVACCELKENGEWFGLIN